MKSDAMKNNKINKNEKINEEKEKDKNKDTFQYNKLIKSKVILC